MESISSKAAGSFKNKEKTFHGQRFDDDLDLNWVQFKWRNYDQQIGRFIQIDPLSVKYVFNSTYAFSENKVTTHIELEGLEGVRFDEFDAKGKLKKITIEKNVIVLLNKTNPEFSDKKNAKIEKGNIKKIESIKRELNGLYNRGNGAKNSDGVKVDFKFNVIGIPDNISTIESKTERDKAYSKISAENSILAVDNVSGPESNGITKTTDRPVGAAVITNESPEGFENAGEALGGTIRASRNFGAIGHEVIHTLLVPDNGYESGGILGRYPSNILTEEVDMIIQQSKYKKN